LFPDTFVPRYLCSPDAFVIKKKTKKKGETKKRREQMRSQLCAVRATLEHGALRPAPIFFRVRSVLQARVSIRRFATAGRSFSSSYAPIGSSAIFAGVGSAFGAGFLWAMNMTPALAEEENKGKKGKADQVCSVEGVCLFCPLSADSRKADHLSAGR
jgi:hypothetical protein